MRKSMATLMATAVAVTGLVGLTAPPAAAAAAACSNPGRVLETVTVRIGPGTGYASVGTRTKGSTVCIGTIIGDGGTYTACGIRSSQWDRISSGFEVPPKWVAGTCILQL